MYNDWRVLKPVSSTQTSCLPQKHLYNIILKPVAKEPNSLVLDANHLKMFGNLTFQL